MSFNRETKIGLGVILGLLLIFSGVLTWRLTRGGPAVVAAEQAERPATAPDLLPKEAQSPESDSPPPTLLSPANSSDPAAKRCPDEAIQWTPAGDGKSKPLDSAAVQEPPPTYPSNPLMAPPTAAAAATADDRYGQENAVRQTAAALAPQANSQADPPGMAPAKDIAPPPAAIAPPAAAQPSQQDARYMPPGNDLPAAPGQAQVVASRARAEDPAYGSNRSDFTPGYGSGVPAYSAGGVAPQVAAPRGVDGAYEVQPNDSFWTISQKVYGSPAYFRALAEHNRGKLASMDRLPPGVAISAPPLAELEKKYPDLCPKAHHLQAARSRAPGTMSTAGLQSGRIYVVEEGDTLFDIARHELGKASRWGEIYELNRDALGKDYHYLAPGMQLRLPEKAAGAPADRTTRRGGDAFRR
jgi:nucleoid-associated protein YgaU